MQWHRRILAASPPSGVRACCCYIFLISYIAVVLTAMSSFRCGTFIRPTGFLEVSAGKGKNHWEGKNKLLEWWCKHQFCLCPCNFLFLESILWFFTLLSWLTTVKKWFSWLTICHTIWSLLFVYDINCYMQNNFHLHFVLVW